MTKKLEKRSSEASYKGSDSEDSNEESNHKKESDNECKLKNNSSLSPMLAEQIQKLVANAVKAHLGGDSHKTHLYKKPYAKRINALRMPIVYQPPKFQKFDGKGTPSSMSRNSSSLAMTLSQKVTSWRSNLCDLLKVLYLIGIQTLLLDPLIVGDKWKVSF